jgi:tRNA A37 threonylcarbamoyladenosine modification protein TsaB
MKNLLAVDTSLTSCSIYLSLDGKEYHRHLKNQAAHAEQFFTWLRELSLLEPDLFQRLDMLGLCIGPGRFNGVRVGMTFISSLMALHQLPAHLCTSHQLLAAQSQISLSLIEGYAIFAKYGHAYWCPKNDWMQTSLLSYEQLPTAIVALDLPMIAAIEHHDSLDIKNLLSLINNKTSVLIQPDEQIQPLYTANLY